MILSLIKRQLDVTCYSLILIVQRAKSKRIIEKPLSIERCASLPASKTLSINPLENAIILTRKLTNHRSKHMRNSKVKIQTGLSYSSPSSLWEKQLMITRVLRCQYAKKMAIKGYSNTLFTLQSIFYRFQYTFTSFYKLFTCFNGLFLAFS